MVPGSLGLLIVEAGTEAVARQALRPAAAGAIAYTGWWEGKFGTVTMRCNAMGREGDEPYTFDVKRAVIELCRSLKHG